MALDKIVSQLQESTRAFTPPLIDIIIKEYGKKPFLILVGCLLSLRAKDVMTIHVCRDLFAVAQSPQQMLCIPIRALEKIIYRVGFYKNKAKQLHEVSQILIDRFQADVPKSAQELLSIKGIGPKTANLVLGLAFDTPAICVDTHVHRISNRLGLIQTKTPEETEAALKRILPKHYWIDWNNLLVMWGQNVCTPLSPFCSTCTISDMCPKIAVSKSR